MKKRSVKGKYSRIPTSKTITLLPELEKLKIQSRKNQVTFSGPGNSKVINLPIPQALVPDIVPLSAVLFMSLLK